MQLIDRQAVLAEIREFQIRFNETGDSHERVAYASAEHCMLVVKAAPAVNRWISVEYEYPEPCKSVLIAFSDSSGVRLQCVGIRSATHPNVWLDMHGGRINNVTHWRNLPEPPKEDENE